MKNTYKNSHALNISLWIVQAILALSLIWAATMKLIQPVEQLANRWPWVAQVPNELVKFTGVIDLLGALGLILPGLVHIQPKLTYLAAGCIVILMLVASIFHISRGEGSQIGVNIVFALLALFVVWGRYKKMPFY